MALDLKGLFGKKTEAQATPAQAAAAAASRGRTNAPAAPKRRRNTGWMIAGGVLILLSALTAASVISSLSETVDVLVAERAIPEGAVVREDDIRTVAIAANTGDISAMAPSQREELIGRVASGPIGQGSILHPDQFSTLSAEDTVATKNVIIGALLPANNLPVLNLKPGDRVRVYETSDASGGVFDDNISLGVAREITDGQVVAVSPLGTSGSTQHIALQVNESTANIITDRIEQGRISLALVESQPSLTPVEPLPPGEPLAPGESGLDE